MRVAIVGGTGAFGRALAKRLQEIGKDEVLVGSRDAERAQATAEPKHAGGGTVARTLATQSSSGSSPLIRRVSTFDGRTTAYSLSSGAAGQASASWPPPQMNAVAA